MTTPPPIDPCTAKNNPKFESLYQNLAKNILNSDGSTKISSNDVRREISVQSELTAAQHDAAKTAILRTTLTQLYSHELPDELRDLITLIACPPSPEDEARLGSFLSNFTPDPSPLGPLVSKELTQLNSQLLHIADPLSGNRCTADQISARKKELERSKARLHDERLDLTNAVCTTLETRQEIFTTAIRVLESVKHGSVARADTAETAYLAMAAEGLDEKLRVLKLETLQSIYTPEVKGAIAAYGGHLAQLKARLRARERIANETLGQYDEVGRSMGKIAERYVGLVQEVEDVKAQIRRLDSKTNEGL